MPIRFRCETCNGKLSIATRKIGEPVECPRCSMSMIVPSSSQLGEELTELLLTVGSRQHTPVAEGKPASRPEPTKSSVPLEEMPLFERKDFEKLLDPRLKQPKPLPLPEENARPPQPVQPQFDPMNYTDAIVISRAKATVLAVCMVVLLGLAFGLGFLVRG